MPRDNGKTIRRLEAARLLNDLLTQLTNVIPMVPHPVSTISSTTAKILEIALTVLRNKDGITELAKSCHEVTTMVINRAVVPTQDTNLLDDIAELQEVLNDIQSTIQKYTKRRKFMSILAANSDKEDIIRCQKRLQHMLAVFMAARTVETQQISVIVQQTVVDTSKKVDSVAVKVQQGVATLQESAVEVQQGVAILQDNSAVIQQTVVDTSKKVDLLIVSALESPISRNSDKPANDNDQTSQQGRKLLISYQTPTGMGLEIALAGVSAFFFYPSLNKQHSKAISGPINKKSSLYLHFPVV
ncbi:hypothetical protein BDQ17DRAFT_1335944 [Cyathus striatus]|nr:hypothetical protein BDQ17DRAFT_1335944 [Cyathus striatus]